MSKDYSKLPEYLPCSAIGGVLSYYQTYYSLEHKPQFSNNPSSRSRGQVYLHDMSIKIHGDCYFKISDLSNTDGEMYDYVLAHEIIPKLDKK
jgi:hypothetical protein